MIPEPEDTELFELHLGEVSPARAAELLAWSQSSRERGQRLTEIGALITALEGRAEVDLLNGLDARLDSARSRRKPRLWQAAAVLAAAASLALVVVQLGSQADVRRKGSGDRNHDKWASVQIHRLAPQGTPELLHGELSPRDSLLFAYTNGGSEPFTHLLIFAVSPTGQVHWYYPAWLRAEDDPSAIAIKASPGLVELREKISQPLQLGPLVIHAVFAREPLHVSVVERVIGASDAGLNEPLPLPGTFQQRYLLRVK